MRHIIAFPFRLVAWIVGLLALALGVVLAAVVGCYLYLQTDKGQLFAGAQASKYATRYLNGQYSIGRVLVSLPEGLHLRDVLVADDTGAAVVSFARFDFDWYWRPLLNRELLVNELSLVSPRVHVRQQPTGFNVADVFKLRNPGPEKPIDPDAKPFELPVDVRLPDVRIVDLLSDVSLANVDPRFATLDTDRIDLALTAKLMRDRSLTYFLSLAGAKSGKVEAEGTVAFKEGFTGIDATENDVRVLALKPANLAGAKVEEILRAEVSMFAHLSWKPGQRYPEADVRGLRVITSAGNITGRASLDAAERFDVRIATDEVRLSRVPWGLIQKDLNVRGDFGFLLEAKGSVREPNVLALVSVCNLVVTSPLVPPQLRGRPSCAKLDARVNTSSSRADLSGQIAGVPLHLRGNLVGNVLEPKGLKTLPFEATLEAGALPIRFLGDLTGVTQLKELTGTAEAAIRVNGTASAPRTHFNITARRVDYGNWKDLNAFLTGETLPGGTHAQLIVHQRTEPIVTLEARILPDAKTLRAPSPLPGVPLSKDALLASRIEIDADIPHFRLPPPAKQNNAIEGYMLVRYEGQRARASGSGHTNGASVVSSLTLLEGETPVGTANISVASDISAVVANPAAWRDIIVNANVEADIPDLMPLTAFVPTLERLTGQASVRVQAQGNLRTPLVGARILLADVDVSPKVGASFNDINVDIAATEKRVDVHNASLDYGGIVRASGYVDGLIPFAPTFALNVNTNKLRVLPLQSGSPTLDADIRLKGALKDGILNAETRIEKLRGYIPDLQGLKGKKAQSLKVPPDVIVVTDTSGIGDPFAVAPPPPPKKPSENTAVREAHMTILAPHNIWLQGPDIQAEIATLTKVDYVDGKVTIDGETRLNRRGFVQVLGKRFTLASAGVEFKNQAPTDGEVAAEVTFAADEATVFINVTGPIAKPEIALSADPEMSQFEIASLIVTGKTAEQLAEKQEAGDGEANTQGEVTAAAANAVGGLVANELLGMFAKNTDLVVSLDVENAQEGQAKVGVGRYVTDRLFVSFDKRFGAEQVDRNSNEVNFDYRLTRRWSVEGNYGDGHEGGIDLLWKKKFGDPR